MSKVRIIWRMCAFSRQWERSFVRGWIKVEETRNLARKIVIGRLSSEGVILWSTWFCFNSFRITNSVFPMLISSDLPPNQVLLLCSPLCCDCQVRDFQWRPQVIRIWHSCKLVNGQVLMVNFADISDFFLTSPLTWGSRKILKHGKHLKGQNLSSVRLVQPHKY